MDRESRRLPDEKGPPLPQRRFYPDDGALYGDHPSAAPLVHPEGGRNRQLRAGARLPHRVFMARSISRLASRWAAASRLS